MTLLLLYASLALGMSFICSLLEASLLSIPRSRVESLVLQGSAAGKRLKALKNELDRPLAAILTVNTVAHTVGATGVGAQAAVTFGKASVGIASAIMTLGILVLSEIIPKTLGAVHAHRLVAVTAYTTRAMMLLCTPIIIPLEWVNRLIGFERRHGRISRMEVLATIRLGLEGGALRDREHRLVSNMMALGSIKLSEVLTPRTVLFALPADRTIGDAVKALPPIRFARIPIYRGSPDDIEGYVARYDIFSAAAAGREAEPLAALNRPLAIIPELATVADALDMMLARNEQIAVVVDEHGGVEGIITLEDLMETLLGEEIVDETDVVPDMQHLARRLAMRRAQRASGGDGDAGENRERVERERPAGERDRGPDGSAADEPSGDSRDGPDSGK